MLVGASRLYYTKGWNASSHSFAKLFQRVLELIRLAHLNCLIGK
jgi:hypothetical protein